MNAEHTQHYSPLYRIFHFLNEELRDPQETKPRKEGCSAATKTKNLHRARATSNAGSGSNSTNKVGAGSSNTGSSMRVQSYAHGMHTTGQKDIHKKKTPTIPFGAETSTCLVRAEVCERRSRCKPGTDEEECLRESKSDPSGSAQKIKRQYSRHPSCACTVDSNIKRDVGEYFERKKHAWWGFAVRERAWRKKVK